MFINYKKYAIQPWIGFVVSELIVISPYASLIPSLALWFHIDFYYTTLFLWDCRRLFHFSLRLFLDFVWWNHHDCVWRNQNSVWNLMNALSQKWCQLKHQSDTQLTKMLCMMKGGNFVWQSPGLHITDPPMQYENYKVLIPWPLGQLKMSTFWLYIYPHYQRWCNTCTTTYWSSCQFYSVKPHFVLFFSM